MLSSDGRKEDEERSSSASLVKGSSFENNVRVWKEITSSESYQQLLRLCIETGEIRRNVRKKRMKRRAAAIGSPSRASSSPSSPSSSPMHRRILRRKDRQTAMVPAPAVARKVLDLESRPTPTPTTQSKPTQSKPSHSKPTYTTNNTPNTISNNTSNAPNPKSKPAKSNTSNGNLKPKSANSNATQTTKSHISSPESPKSSKSSSSSSSNTTTTTTTSNSSPVKDKETSSKAPQSALQRFKDHPALISLLSRRPNDSKTRTLLGISSPKHDQTNHSKKRSSGHLFSFHSQHIQTSSNKRTRLSHSSSSPSSSSSSSSQKVTLPSATSQHTTAPQTRKRRTSPNTLDTNFTQTYTIKSITPNDVIFYTSKKEHSGMNKYLKLIDSHLPAFSTATWEQKRLIVQQLIAQVQQFDPPGRFFRPHPHSWDHANDSEATSFTTPSDEWIRNKTRKFLTDKTRLLRIYGSPNTKELRKSKRTFPKSPRVGAIYSTKPSPLLNQWSSLSQFNRLVIENIEFFIATQQDINNHSTRVRPIRVGQVGVRCVGCARAGDWSPGHSVFPGSLSVLGHNVFHFGSRHFLERCQQVSKDLRADLKKAKPLSTSQSMKKGAIGLPTYLSLLCEHYGIGASSSYVGLTTSTDGK